MVGKWLVAQPGNNDYIIQIGEGYILSNYTYEMGIAIQMKIISISKESITLRPIIEGNISGGDKQKSDYQILKESDYWTVISLKYEIDGDYLLLTDGNNKVNKAISCKSGKCDEQKDFFKTQGVVIDLPSNHHHLLFENSSFHKRYPPGHKKET